MGTTKFTAFGLCVKKKLLDIGQPQKWLEEEIRQRTGLFVDAGYMYKILTGQRDAPKVTQAICEVLNLSEQDHDTA